jgi:hypothetical protein
MTAWHLDRAIEALARKQHGAFNRRQAYVAGASKTMVSDRIRSGRWIHLGNNVFALPGNPPTWERQCMAATLAIIGAALCGPPAGALHRQTGMRRGRPHIVVPPGGSRRCDLAVVHESRHIEVTRVQGIPVTTAAQTLIDLGAHLPRMRVRAALHDAISAQPELLALVQDRYVDLSNTRWPHLCVIRELLAELGDGEAPTASELERALDVILLKVPGLPLGGRQAPLPWRPEAPQRVDRLIAAWSLIAEADGRRWHTRVDDFERDRDRDNEAAVHGLHVMRFTWTRLTQQADVAVDQLQRYAMGRALAA